MSSTPQEFKHETLQDPQAVVRYLSALGEGLAKGQLFFRAGDQEFLLQPQGLIRFSVKAKRDGRRARVTARLTWKERESDASGPAEPIPPPLTIEATNPSR